MKSNVKSNREVYLDLAKFFAMIMMVAGHSFFEFTIPNLYNLKVFPWDWWSFARGKTAPMFLFLSGTVHVFANYKLSFEKISSLVFKKRLFMAMILIVIAYTLNSPINSIEDLFNISQEKIDIFSEVNILHIFGIGLLILSLIYRFVEYKFVMIISFSLGLLITIITPFIINLDLSVLPKFISNYFNYDNGSIFVLTPYLSYLFFGTCFGIILKEIKSIKSDNLNHLYIKLFSGKNKFILGLILIAIGTFIIKLLYYFGLSIDLRSNPGVVFRNLGIIISVLFLVGLIKIHNQKIVKIISILSARAIYIYVIHLFIIYGIGNIKGFKHYYAHTLNIQESFLLTFSVIISTIFITLLIDFLIKFKSTKYYFIGLILIYWIYFLLQ